MITLRKCQLEDLELLHDLSRKTFYETFKDDNSAEDMALFLDDAYNMPKLKRELNDKDVSFYFVYKDQHLAGYMKLNVLDAQQEDLGEDALEIERLYLLPGFQGQGIGTHLLYEAEAIAREQDKSKLWLGVWEHNDQAIHLYEKLGYKKFGEHVFQVGSDKQIDELMMKEL